MRTIVHLSDLHFGRVDPDLLRPLQQLVTRLAPDVVVVSGDLTQRARTEEFKAARAWLDTLPGPQIVVPGNHDIPLYNVASRFLTPLRKYTRYVTLDLAPEYVDEEIAILGINTARSLTFKDGRVNKEQLAQMRQRMQAAGPDHTRIIVTHHPFDLPELRQGRPGRPRADGDAGVCRMRRRCAAGRPSAFQPCRQQRAALQDQRLCGAGGAGRHGHLHARARRIQFLQRAARAPDDVQVERYSWIEGTASFEPVHTECFRRSGDVWSLAAEA
jgi:3',5'-cyclic AMP phosphodiesterase CpdA